MNRKINTDKNQRKSASNPRRSILENKKRLLLIFILGISLSLFAFTRTVKPKLIYPSAKLLSEKSIYKASESPKFTLNLGPKITPRSYLGFVPPVQASEEPQVHARVLTSENKESLLPTEIQKNNNGTYAIKIPPRTQFRPGKYKIEAQIQTGGGTRDITQDFSWGVLALNTNKSIYNPNETAKLFFSVLNEGGFNDCDARLSLTIKSPDEQITVLSSENGKIKKSKTCAGDNVTYEPDYYAIYQTSIEGEYQMDLKAVTQNGAYEIKDYFEVKNNQDFDVERITATRINPVSPYTVKLKIKARKDFEGKIIESLPYAFGVKKNNNGKVSFDKGKYTHTIVWNEKIQKGETKELSYEFKAPEISPEFYLLGPLEFRNSNLVFREARQWQIAADPTSMILLWDPTNGATPSGWTCISCSTGDTFFQKIIRGNSTYGGTGGGSTETPTIATFTVSAESLAENTAKAGANAASGTTHTHTASNPTIGSGNIIPAFKTLMVIKYNSGIPTGASAIPQNAIAFFDATVPTGWTRYGTQDGNYVRGDWTNTAGGSNTQTHTITWQSLANASTAEDVTVANGGTSAVSAHTHTAPSQTSTASINTEPPYIETILGSANANTAIPNAMIGMFDGAPGTGWALKSNTGGDPFFQTFPKAAATYGTTGGATTHNHAAETSGVSGGPSGTTTNGAGALSVAADTHTHTENATFNTGGTNVPPYTDAIFAQKTFSISGTVRQSNESTAIGNPPCDSSTGVIDIRINNGAPTTVSCLSTDSTYTATPGTVVAGDVITILLNASSTPKANTIIRAGATDATSADLYQNIVIARSDDVSAISNANICISTTSMLFSCATNNITVNSNIEFHVWTGDAYTAGGATLTTQGTGNLHVASSATATLDTATNTIGNDIVIDTSATLNINGSTIVAGGDITATGTLASSGTPTLTMRGTGSITGAGSKTFYNLTIGDATVASTTLTGTATASNNVSVGTDSTFNINADLAVTGNLTNTTTGIINQTANSPVVTVSGTSIGGGSGNITFYRLQKAGAGTTTFSGSGTNTINNTLDATAGTLTLSTNNVVTVTGNVSASNSATLNQNTALTINGGSLLTSGTGVVNTTAGTGTVTINNTGTIGGGGTVAVYALQINGSQTVGSALTANNSGNVAAGASLNLGGQNVNSGGNFTTTTTGTITCTGTSGTFTMTAGGSLGGGSGVITFCNLATTTTGTTTFTGTGTNTVNNNVSVGTGTILNINSTIAVTGNLTNTTTGIINQTANSPVVTVSGTSIGGGSGNITFYRLQKAGAGTTTFSGSGTNTINNTLDATAGTLTLSTNNVVTVTGNVSASNSATLNQNTALTINGGSLLTSGTGVVNTTAGTGTVTVNNTGTIGGGGTVAVYNLIIGGTQTLASATTSSTDVSVSSGATLALGSQNLTVNGGDLTTTTTGSVTCSACSSGTVTMATSGNLGAGAGGTITVYNLSVGGSAGTTTLTSDIVVNNTAAVVTGGGSLALGSKSLTVSGGALTTAGTSTITCTACSAGTVTISGTGNIGGGGTVTVYNLAVNGSQTAASTVTANNTISVGSSGTFTLSGQNVNSASNFTTTTTGVIACSGTTGTATMTGGGNLGGGSGAITFCNLATTTAGTTTFTGSGTNTVNNNVSVGTGTTLNLNSTISITGSLTNTTSGVIGTSAGTPTVTVSGTSIGGGTTGAITFYNLTKAGAGTTTFSNDGTNTVNTNLSVSAGTLTQSSTLTVTGDVSVNTGATFNTNAALNINGGDLTTTTTGVVNTTAGTGAVTMGASGNVGAGAGGSITVYNFATSGTGTTTLTSALTANNDVAVGANTTLALSNQDLTIGGGDFTTGSSSIISCGCSAGTVTVNGTAATGIGGNSASINFFNLTVGGTVPIASAVTVNNDLTSNGTTSGSSNVTVNGTVAGTGTISMSGGTFEQRVAAAENFGTTGGVNPWSFATLLFSNSSAADRTITTQTGGSGTITASTLLQLGKAGDTNQTILDAGNRTWTLSATSGAPFDIVSPSTSSSLTASTSTFSYTGANGGGDTTIQNATYNNLTLNASDTFVPEASPLAVDGDLTVTLGTLSLSSNSMTVGSSGVANSGDISVAGSLTQTASGTTTVRTSTGGTASIGGAGTLTFYNLTIAPAVAAEPTITLGTGASQTITVSNDLTIGNGTNAVTVTGATNNPALDVNGSVSVAASGTLTAPGSTGSFNIAVNFTNNGTFNHNSGTVTLDTASDATLNGSGSPAITFFNFKSIIPGKIIKFTNGKTFRINGLFTMTGATGGLANKIKLQSTSPGSSWTINHQGTEDITYTKVTDSACAGQVISLDTTNTDGGGNGVCWEFAQPIIQPVIKGDTRIKGSTRFK